MESVGLRELKNRLSEYVNRVKAGEVVLVTDRGKAVAELGPVSGTDHKSKRLSLADLARAGLITLGEPNEPDLYPLMTPVGGRSSSELLDEERGTR